MVVHRHTRLATPSSTRNLYFDGTQATCSFAAFGGSYAPIAISGNNNSDIGVEVH